MKETKYFDVLTELFKKDGALDKYAKVRHTLYEMEQWHTHGMPLSQVDRAAKLYFSKRFLKSISIREATGDQIDKAFQSLNFAAANPDTGCQKKCLELMEQLNTEMQSIGLATLLRPQSFLDYLTFSYQSNVDGGYEVRVFNDGENLKKFRGIVRKLLKTRVAMSMQDIYRNI